MIISNMIAISAGYGDCNYDDSIYAIDHDYFTYYYDHYYYYYDCYEYDDYDDCCDYYE